MDIYQKLATLTDKQLGELVSYTLGLHMSRKNKDAILRKIEGEISSRAFLRACKN